MSVYQQHKQKVLQLMRTTAEFAKTNRHEDTKKRLDEASRHLIEGKLVVVVCGEFKQGKSSLLNALLEENDLFPVDVDITTNVVSTIAYGEREKFTVITGEPGRETSKIISRDDIKDYVTEQRNRNNKRQARMLILQSPNKRLKEGLVLADTPGIGSLNINHTDITYGYIPNADAVIFVSDALAPLSAAELKFVEMIARHSENVIYVVTKIDAVGSYKAIVESNREKLSRVLNRPESEITIVPVSSLNKLAYLKNGDEEDLEDSNFTAFENELWRMLSERRGSILLMRALNEVNQSLAEMRTPVQAELTAFQQLTERELDEFEKQHFEARDRYQALLENDAIWRPKLNQGLVKIRSSILENFQAGIAAIKRLADEYIDDAALLAQPEHIANLLEVDVDALLTDLGKELSVRAANLHETIETATGLGINYTGIGKLTREKITLPNMNVDFAKQSMWEKSITVTRSATFSGGAGSTIGSIIGGVLGGVVGTLITPGAGTGAGIVYGAYIGATVAGVAGLKTGVKQGLEQIREKELAVVKKKVARIIGRFIEDSQRLAYESLKNAVTNLEHAMQDELLAQVRRQKKMLEETLQSIQRGRKMSQEQAAKRGGELKERLRQLQQIQETANQSVNVIASQAIVAPINAPKQIRATANSINNFAQTPAVAADKPIVWDSE